MKPIVFLIVFVNITLLCFSQPRWYPNAYSQYNDDTYIAGTASSNSRIDAEHRALGNLTTQINVRVRNDELNILNYSESQSEIGTPNQQGFQNDREIKLHTTLSSDINLINAKMIIENRRGVYYALALIEIPRFINDLSYAITENERMTDDYIRNAEIAHGSLRSISFWKLAYQLAEETEKSYRIRASLSKNPSSFSTPKHSSASLLNTYERFRNLQTISVNVQGDLNGRVASAFLDVFTSRGFRIGAGNPEGARYNTYLQDNQGTSGYILSAEFRIVNESSRDPDWSFVQAVLIWTFSDPEGRVLISSDGAITERGGSRSVDRARETALLEIEKSINGAGFADKFDGILK